jgi:hypothetical protein
MIIALCEYTNLPDVPPDLFEVSARTEIQSKAREVFNGPLAGILNATFEKRLQLYYEAQWQGLKLLLE